MDRRCESHTTNKESPMSAANQTADDETVTCRKCHATYVPDFVNDFYADGADPKVGLCERCKMSEVFAVNTNQPHPLPNEGHAKKVCKSGQSAATCAFLSAGGGSGEVSFKCAKDSMIEVNIRQRLAEGTMGAKGDNCSGPPDFTPSLT